MQNLIEFIKDTAVNAGKILKEGYGTKFKISSKDGINNLVTEYDHKAEEYIISRIKETYPNDSVLAEESGKTGDKDSDHINWIVDPLDGTVNFAHGIPIFSVSIAAELKGEIIAGAIYQPILDELFWAEKGNGAFLNGHKMHVSETNDFKRAFLVTGFPYNVSENPCNCVDLFVKFVQQGIPVRRLGSAALDLAYVAAGRFDAFWELELKPWDVAAGVLLVKEAGGNVTQFDNSEYTVYDKTLLASNAKIHDKASSVLNYCAKSCHEA